MDGKLLAHGKAVARLHSWRLQMTIPSVLAEGEEFRLRLVLTGPDGLCVGEKAGDAGEFEVLFEGSEGVEGLPPSARLAPGTDGAMEITDLKAIGPQLAVVRGKVQGRTVMSNPAWVFRDPPYRLYWGDLHVHTTFSNCMPWSCKSPEFGYAYAKDVACLDFAAAADHLRGIADESNRWTQLQELARRYNLPGEFVAILAFESSHKRDMGGDNNAYLLDDGGPYFWLDRDDMKGNSPAVPLEQLWDFLDQTGLEYFTIPHHTGRAAKYRCFDCQTYSPQREPLFEIYSAWGSSERQGTIFPLHGGNSDKCAYFVDAIRAGCRYGIICSSDDHTTMPGGETRNWGQPLGGQAISGYSHKGLAAVWSKGLDRRSLWEAMTSRRTYGTTLDRTIVDVRLGDLGMGQEARLDRSDSMRRSRDIRVRLSMAQQAPAKVTLVRNGTDVAKQAVQGTPGLAELTFHDGDDLESVVIRDGRFHPQPFVAYYLRISNSRNETQWTSPIWLDL